MHIARSSADFELIREIRRVARAYRMKHPLTRAPWEASSYPLATNIGGSPDVKTLVWFPGPGCTWSEAGGCLMCNFGVGTPGEADPIGLFQSHLAELDPGTRHVHIGPGGSFYDNRETPPDHRHGVLKSLHALREIQTVGLETRPTLVTRDNLAETLDDLPPSVNCLILGFGIECWDDFVREVSVNKGYDRESLARAASVIAELNAAQIDVRIEFETYVLLKPTLLTEQEAIDEALRTISWSFASGASTCALFLNTIKDQTVQGHLAGHPAAPTELRYQSPYLRSAIEVLRRLPAEQRLRTTVLGLQSGIMATDGPRGSERCYPFLLGALYTHSFARSPKIIEVASRAWCPCLADWERELRQPPGLDVRGRARLLVEFMTEDGFG